MSQERDPKSVLEELASALTAIPIDYVIFTTYRPEQDFELETGETPSRLNTYLLIVMYLQL